MEQTGSEHSKRTSSGTRVFKTAVPRHDKTHLLLSVLTCFYRRSGSQQQLTAKNFSICCVLLHNSMTCQQVCLVTSELCVGKLVKQLTCWCGSFVTLHLLDSGLRCMQQHLEMCFWHAGTCIMSARKGRSCRHNSDQAQLHIQASTSCVNARCTNHASNCFCQPT